MAQAKTLTPAEIEQLLLHINTRKYAARNRSMMLLTHWAGHADVFLEIFVGLLGSRGNLMCISYRDFRSI